MSLAFFPPASSFSCSAPSRARLFFSVSLARVYLFFIPRLPPSRSNLYRLLSLQPVHKLTAATSATRKFISIFRTVLVTSDSKSRWCPMVPDGIRFAPNFSNFQLLSPSLLPSNSSLTSLSLSLSLSALISSQLCFHADRLSNSALRCSSALSCQTDSIFPLRSLQFAPNLLIRSINKELLSPVAGGRQRSRGRSVPDSPRNRERFSLLSSVPATK